ncbi:hypothetical protein MES5069_1390015 [Mesorhizobium escarrei]|uniref:Uncharacterized protein n=1 Tax=Mesorhizobium escarrei TaxID=666018 RepID=A0ABM9DJF3_9HYPH|nr:hypothetical protein MES5069_1390015 [Mesorhizobium escarrei]
MRRKRPESKGLGPKKAWSYCAVTAQAADACSKNIHAVKASLSFTGVYYVHPVIWILTEWLEPLCLTPPC